MDLASMSYRQTNNLMKGVRIKYHAAAAPAATPACRGYCSPASSGVCVTSESACTGARSSSASTAYTRRWRLMEVRPWKRGDTTTTLKCVSPL